MKFHLSDGRITCPGLCASGLRRRLYKGEDVLRPNKKICVVPVTRPIQISGTFPSPIPVLVLVSTMVASLIEAGPTCSVLSLTFNKCDHLKETKSIIVPVINSRTFNDIFEEHHDLGLKNIQCKVMSQSHVVTPALTVGEVVSNRFKNLKMVKNSILVEMTFPTFISCSKTDDFEQIHQ